MSLQSDSMNLEPPFKHSVNANVRFATTLALAVQTGMLTLARPPAGCTGMSRSPSRSRRNSTASEPMEARGAKVQAQVNHNSACEHASERTATHASNSRSRQALLQTSRAAARSVNLHAACRHASDRSAWRDGYLEHYMVSGSIHATNACLPFAPAARTLPAGGVMHFRSTSADKP